MVHFLANRIVGEEEAASLADETVAWIQRSLGSDYAWPGNVRELEQCVRNILVRGEYHPSDTLEPEPDFMAALRAGRLTAEDVLNRYCRLVYDRTGDYSKTARALGLDRRTVKSRILRGGGEGDSR
jgi:transcriptional regulator of acetoin/glycerol metabolism